VPTPSTLTVRSVVVVGASATAVPSMLAITSAATAASTAASVSFI
jgi:hypothetical protein